MRRRWTNVWNESVRLAVEETAWGGPSENPMVVAHATGFCKEVMHPLIDELAARVPNGRLISFDHRNHGASSRADRPHDWWTLARDVLAVAEGRTGESGIGLSGIGHSCGGAALVYAELLRPGSFRSLVLVEPIIFPEGPDTELEERLARGALRRKPAFATRSEAFDNFAGKPVFAGWADAALQAYVDHGLHPGSSGLALACDPQDEADFFRQSRRRSAWPRLGEVECDIAIVVGEHSNSHSPEFVEMLAGRFTGTAPEVVVVPDTTHFLPMENPGSVASLTARFAFELDSHQRDARR